MNIAGKRVGPSEYEAVATSSEQISSAAAVGVGDPIKGEVAVLVITCHTDADHDSVRTVITAKIEGLMGKALRPKDVFIVTALPLTVSGKIHRRAVRAWLTRRDPGDLSGVQHLNHSAEIKVHTARFGAGVTA